MDRAANALYWRFIANFTYKQPVCVIAGPGNNGGDALALASMLLFSGFIVNVYQVHTGSLSTDCKEYKKRLIDSFPDSYTELHHEFIAPEVTHDTIIVDGLFGSGLSRPLTGIYAQTVEWMNQSACKIFSIDIPSGLLGEVDHLKNGPTVKAYLTICLQFPKLSFFYPENELFIGKWQIDDIGILKEAIQKFETKYFYLEQSDVEKYVKQRSKFSHKGNFGHALIVAGSRGMAGASVLAGKAAMRTGAGLVTVYGPEDNRSIVQTALPEAIFQTENAIGLVPVESFDAVALGPGIGMSNYSVELIKNILKKMNQPCVVDADALNIIAAHHLIEFLPPKSIITPHPKEFERLFGTSGSTYERLLKAQQIAQQRDIYIILKGAHTAIITPEAEMFFNSTGNPGMATAGSGDVLTGVLAGLLAQGYAPAEAAKLGVFIHGKAGDFALDSESEESMLAGDIISKFGKVFKLLKTSESSHC